MNIVRFRNYPGFRNYDSETTIQKLCRPIQQLRFSNYFRPIQKLFSTDSETILDRFSNFGRPIQKLRSSDSETIFDRFSNYDSAALVDRFRNYVRPIQKLFSTDSETTIERFSNATGFGMRWGVTITFIELGHTVDATPLCLGWGGMGWGGEHNVH